MAQIRTLPAAMTLAALAWPGLAAAQDDTAARIQALEAQVQALSQQLSELKAAAQAEAAARAEAQASAPAAPPLAVAQSAKPAAPATQVSIKNGRPTFASADGRFSASLRGVMQLDTAMYFQDDDLPPSVTARDLNGGANFRRARIGVDGKLFGDFDYRILMDFGGAGSEDAGRVQELWLQYSNLGPFAARVGAFAPSLGLADAASTNGAMFPERAAVADIARGLAGGDKRIGAGLIGSGERWHASAVVTGATASGVNSAAADFNDPTYDEQQGFAVRLAGTPVRGEGWLVHAGANASVITQPDDDGAASTPRYSVRLTERPELRVDGARLVDTGSIEAYGAHAYGFELAFQRKNLLFQGEYFDLGVDRRNPAAGVSDPEFSGWYIEGGWVLTGEARKYSTDSAAFDAPSVARPFDPAAGAWGAWELAARYSVVDLNSNADSAIVANRVRGGEQEIWSLGVNWFVNPAVRFSLGVQDVSVERLNAAGLPLDQDYRSLNLRSQFAF
ncbi:MAG: OprO/OprP family phosphate-selective porin [Phenylobacterium sp.]|uniref:OprO/OprP family phosphate-selective porin n=1 Tax=Phenylobacterium sp. TaxID=1871053 RepID=UPI00391D54F3